jgi:hypothetical protein
VLAAGAPILVSLAAPKGWTGPLIVLALFVVLELFTNLVLETVLYAGAVGVSQVVLLVSVTFWTWLWGPLWLLMASPLTVCLVVLGKHVPGLAFVGVLMDDTPALAPESALSLSEMADCCGSAFTWTMSSSLPSRWRAAIAPPPAGQTPSWRRPFDAAPQASRGGTGLAARQLMSVHL